MTLRMISNHLSGAPTELATLECDPPRPRNRKPEPTRGRLTREPSHILGSVGFRAPLLSGPVVFRRRGPCRRGGLGCPHGVRPASRDEAEPATRHPAGRVERVGLRQPARHADGLRGLSAAESQGAAPSLAAAARRPAGLFREVPRAGGAGSGERTKHAPPASDLGPFCGAEPRRTIGGERRWQDSQSPAALNAPSCPQTRPGRTVARAGLDLPAARQSGWSILSRSVPRPSSTFRRASVCPSFPCAGPGAPQMPRRTLPDTRYGTTPLIAAKSAVMSAPGSLPSVPRPCNPVLAPSRSWLSNPRLA